MSKARSLLGTLLITLTGCASNMQSAAAGLRSVRPVIVHVTDAESGKPLEHVLVSYVLVRGTYRTSSVFGLFPPIEPLIKETIAVKRSSYTNSRGQVDFPAAEVELADSRLMQRHDRIASEMIFVNLKPSDGLERRSTQAGAKLDAFDLLFRSLPELAGIESAEERYKGYWLSIVDVPTPHERDQERATVRVIPSKSGEAEAGHFQVPLKGVR